MDVPTPMPQELRERQGAWCLSEPGAVSGTALRYVGRPGRDRRRRSPFGSLGGRSLD